MNEPSIVHRELVRQHITVTSVVCDLQIYPVLFNLAVSKYVFSILPSS